jgi:oxalate decarboxylase/phosphoglucose isomerase-like protein (cupin superfamily)
MQQTAMTHRQQIDPSSVPTQTIEWGAIKWFVTPHSTQGAGMTFGEVVLLPGKGHDRHNHPTSEEILYVLSGEGRQMLDDGEPFPVKAGDTIYVPTAVFHSTVNTGWEPLRLLAIYNPGGPEKVLEGLPDFQQVAAGQVPRIVRGSSMGWSSTSDIKSMAAGSSLRRSTRRWIKRAMN